MCLFYCAVTISGNVWNMCKSFMFVHFVWLHIFINLVLFCTWESISSEPSTFYIYNTWNVGRAKVLAIPWLVWIFVDRFCTIYICFDQIRPNALLCVDPFVGNLFSKPQCEFSTSSILFRRKPNWEQITETFWQWQMMRESILELQA